MNLVETGNLLRVEAYKDSIMKRYELAQAMPGGANCHDATYYLLGVKPKEYGLDGVCRVYLDISIPVDNINNALFVAFGARQQSREYDNILGGVHIATIHPYDKTKVIHRDIDGYYETRRSHHNFLTGVVDTWDMFTKGLNPMRIESLKATQERWKSFSMQLYTFKPEYFEKLLSSLGL